MLFQDPVFLVIIRLGEGLIDVNRARRTGGPFADEEILYGKGGYEPIVPSYEACAFWHGGREGKVGVRMTDWRAWLEI